MTGKFFKYKDEIIEHFKEGIIKDNINSFLDLKGIEKTKNNKDQLRNYVRVLRESGIIFQKLKENNLTNNDWSIAWIKDKNVSLLVKNKNNRESVSLEDIREEFKQDLKEYSPKRTKIKRRKLKDPHCLVLDIADLHVGKLATLTGTGSEYNVEIAKKRAFEATEGLIQKASGWNIDKILFVIGNDVLHTDNMTRSTTNGTPQDTDGMWYDNFKIAKGIYIYIIECLLELADVHIVHNPSNHDFMSGFMLADTIYSWFRNSKNITFDLSLKHRKYFKYGNSLIATTHGDGAKIDKLPLLIAEESKDMWADTCYRYAYLHHLHSKHQYKFKASEDFIGITVEYLRSPSGTDYWHHKAGYQHACVAIEAFLHSKEGGQCARLTHVF